MRLQDFLERNPKARERKYKNRAVAYMLKKTYHDLAEVPLDKLTDAVASVNSLDREWRKILEENPHLRGKDYSQKAKLVKEKQRELGYPV